MGISYNRVCLIGRLTRDPESRFLASGKQITTFSLAVDRSYSQNGQQSADFFSVVAFGKLAEVVSNYCQQGKLILVDGEVHIDQYEKDGNRRTATKIIAGKIQFLETRGAAQSERKNEPQDEEVTFFGADDETGSDELPF